MNLAVPKEVKDIADKLVKSNFEAYLVGGCVRDLILGGEPSDWDLTTNATPDQIQAIFPDSFYENDYGTVGVKTESTDETLKVVEVTPYRIESTYSDFRRPDSVTFSTNIQDDLKRRDFTINALAYDIYKGQILDLYKGQNDLKEGVIRTVGDPYDRFNEDGLRILRAVRFHAQLGFDIEKGTQEAIVKSAHLLEKIAKERIRDEFSKIIDSKNPEKGLNKAREVEILQFIAPELLQTIGVDQNQAHAFDVWNHLIKSLQHAANKNYSFHVKIAALFHDISKPETRRFSKEKSDWTFYGHDVVGSRVTRKILKNLKYPSDLIEVVSKLVGWHMFFSDTEKITLSAVRRLVSNVGSENVWDLMDLRTCDRIGTGRPKENPYRLRKYRSMIEEALRDPITVGMLKVDGNDFISDLKLKPSPTFGLILNALLEEALEDPQKNTRDYLLKKARELSEMDGKELEKLGKEGKQKRIEEEQKIIDEIRKKHHVS